MTASTASPDVRFIFVRPRNSGNLGMVVRSLRNFGFPPPRVVDMYRFSETEAQRMAAGCDEEVAKIEFFPDLESALADRVFVVGTTAAKRSRWRLVPVDQGIPAFTDSQLEAAAILFGNEQSGLSETELTRCEQLITIPTVDYSSLNLSHATTLVAWELRKHLTQRPYEPPPRLATRELTEPMFEQMYGALEAISFLHPGHDEKVRILLRQLFSRNGLTPRDVKVLRGIWRQINWLAGKAGSQPKAE
jgi:tRNA/rRNA methyltransferase